MPQPRKVFPTPRPGYIYENCATRYVILKVVGRGNRRILHVYTTTSGRISKIRHDCFLKNYELRSCRVP